jgi:hypothetical protein
MVSLNKIYHKAASSGIKLEVVKFFCLNIVQEIILISENDFLVFIEDVIFINCSPFVRLARGARA